MLVATCGFFLFDPIKLRGGWERTIQRNEGDKYFPVGKNNDFFVFFRLECLGHVSFFIHGERQPPKILSEERDETLGA